MKTIVVYLFCFQELSDISMKFCKKIETSMEECIEKNDEVTRTRKKTLVILFDIQSCSDLYSVAVRLPNIFI